MNDGSARGDGIRDNFKQKQGVSMMQIKGKFKVKVTKIAALTIVAIAAAGVLVFAHFETMRSLLREEIRHRLMTIATAATMLIDPEKHEKIAQAKDPNDPLYRKAVAKLRILAQQTLPEVQTKGMKLAREAIYTLVPSTGTTWHFVLDTMLPCDRDGDGKFDDDELPAQIGEPYDVSDFPEMRRCFLEGKPTADTDLTVDKWGVWLSGYAPLKDKNGRVVAVVGVDMNAETLAVMEKDLLKLAVLTFAVIILTISFLALLLYRWQSTYGQLARTEELQRKLVEISTDLVFSLDPDGRIKSVSAKVRSYGYGSESLIGHSITDFVSPESKEQVTALLASLRKGEHAQPAQIGIVTSNGQIRQGEWRCFGVYEDKRLVEVWGVFYDLSQLLLLTKELKHKAEELQEAQVMLVQQERLKALGQMASGISHDIGNALVPLLAYAELLEEHPDPKVREWGRQIGIATEDIMHIVQRLRAFYRLRDPNEALEPVNLNEIVRQVVDLTKPRWYDMPQREGITIDMSLDLDESLPTIGGITAELREALTNLIFNAVDAIVAKGETEGTITIRTGRRDRFVFLEVNDTGIGMDEEIKRRCMEPFFTTKGEKGSGLGLMMVYGTMQRHEGQVEIESELGKGSTFRLLFPLRGAEAGESEEEEAKELPPLRILLVDDDPRVRRILGELMKSWGHTIVVAEDGINALDAFLIASRSGQPFDVVITDLGMPRMNGAELVRRIREHDHQVPIIIVTAWGKEHFVPEADIILGKPVHSQDLKSALWKVVRQRKVSEAVKGL